MGDDEVEEEGGDDGPIEEVEEEAISVGLVEGWTVVLEASMLVTDGGGGSKRGRCWKKMMRMC